MIAKWLSLCSLLPLALSAPTTTPSDPATTNSRTVDHLILVPITQSLPHLSCTTYHGVASTYYLLKQSASCASLRSEDPSSANEASWLCVPLPSFNSASGTSALESEGVGHLMHAQASVLDLSVPELATRVNDIRLTRLGESVKESYAGQQQHALISSGANEEEEEVLFTFPNEGGEILYFPTSTSLRTFTSSPHNAFIELVAIPPWPLPLPPSQSSTTTSSTPNFYPPPIPVPADEIARIQYHLDNLKFQPLVSTLLESIDKPKFKTDVRYLTGEDQSAAKSEAEEWVSRHSMSEGGHKASAWLLGQFISLGLNCSQNEFLPNFAPMIACIFPGSGQNETDGTVVLGAHFDSRGSFGYPQAPGADDDGSGTSLLLSLAAHIQSHGLLFKRKLILAAFAGEEQGLLGSSWFAKELKARGEDVVLMVQVDMIGYRKPGEPLQLAFPPDHLGLQEARFLVGNLSAIYVPELVVGITPACCSDHQSFMAQGYSSTWVFERNGPIADPFYHNSGDLSSREGYDWEQIWLASKVVLATVLEVAGFSFP